MDDRQRTRRKTVGRRLARARRAAGHRSQAAFAAAIGVHETSVARAESGQAKVGADVFTRIELGLRLPDDIITRYIETGDANLLERITYPPVDPAPDSPAESNEDEELAGEDPSFLETIRKVLEPWGLKPTPKIIASMREEWALMDLEKEDEKDSGESATAG